MVACNDYTSCLPDYVSGMAYDLLAASARLERIAVVVETVSTQDCSVKFSLREENQEGRHNLLPAVGFFRPGSKREKQH